MPKPSLFPPKFFDPHLDARTKLEAEISQLEKRLIELKVARNSLLPISTLHSEILQDIFFQVNFHIQRRGRSSLRLSWVSHGWRQIALDTCDIWTHIDYPHLEWAKTALSRTKNSQLEVDLNHSAWRPHGKDINLDPLPITSLCLSHLSRMRKLHISAQNRDDNTSFPDSAPEWMIQAPHLVELSLERFTLPPNLFSGSCPSLRSVRLAGCHFDWDTLHIPQDLEHFTVVAPQILVSVEGMVDILEIMGSSIERLSLIGAFDPDDLSIGSSERDRIPLPNLASLSLNNNLPVVFEHLFNHIALPPRVNVNLDTCVLESVDSYMDMIDALIASRDIEKWPVDCLEVRVSGDDFTIRIEENWINTETKIAQHRGQDTSTFIKLEFWAIEDPSRLWRIFDLLPIHPIEDVSLIGEGDIQNTDISNYIGRLGTVRKLSIGLSALGSFCTRILELREHIQLKDSEVDSEVKKIMAQNVRFFPGLQELQIHGNGFYEESFSGENLEYIQLWLQRRDWLGVPVERLVLSDMLAPPIRWIKKEFGGIVLSLRMSRLQEDEDWEESEMEGYDGEESETEESDVEDSDIEE